MLWRNLNYHYNDNLPVQFPLAGSHPRCFRTERRMVAFVFYKQFVFQQDARMEGWRKNVCIFRRVYTDMLIGGFSRNLLIWVALYMKINTMIRKLTQKRVLVYVPSDCGKDALLVKHLPSDGLRDGLWRKDYGCIRIATSPSSWYLWPLEDVGHKTFRKKVLFWLQI